MRIVYGPSAKESDVTDHSKSVLEKICATCGIDSVVISSTQRGPNDQARVMYENIVSKGVQAQKALYAAAGDSVIDTYVAAKAEGKDRDGIIKAMEDKIIEIGPQKVSRHASDPKVLNVFDIAPSSIPSAKKAAFENAVHSNPWVSKFLMPPSDPGYHLEIPQPPQKKG